MDYLKIYNRLVQSRKFRGLDKKALDFYTEKHHIVPRAVGGNNAKANLVLLSAREHLLAHRLLWKIDKSNKFYQRAYFMMAQSGQYELSSREYARAKERLVKLNTGEGNPFYGRRHTEEAKRRTGLASKGHTRVSPEKYKEIALKNTGRKRSDDARKKISEKAVQHMAKPWRCSGVVKSLELTLMWANADLVYDLWKDTGLGIRKLTNLYNLVYCDDFNPSRLKTMLELFREGWTPVVGREWIDFKEKHV